MAAAPQLGLLTPSAQGIPLLRESSPVSSSQHSVDTQVSPTNSPDSPEPMLLCLLTGSLYPLLSISDLSRGAVTVLLAAQKVPTHHHVLNSSVSTSSYTLVLLTSLELLSSFLLVLLLSHSGLFGSFYMPGPLYIPRCHPETSTFSFLSFRTYRIQFPHLRESAQSLLVGLGLVALLSFQRDVYCS